MHDVEDHHAVRLAEVHLHGTLELHAVAAVVLDVEAPDEGTAGEQAPREAAAPLDREVVAARHFAVGLVAMGAVAAAVLLHGDGPVVVAVGVEVEQVGIAVAAVLGRRPVELLRGVERGIGPVDPHLVVGGVPGPGVGAELQVGVDRGERLLRAGEEAVDHRGAPLDPLLEPGALAARPAPRAVLLPGVDVLGEALDPRADVGLEGPAREVGEVRLDVVVACAVEQDAVQIVARRGLGQHGDLVLLHLGQRRIGEEDALALDLLLGEQPAARHVVDRLPLGMVVDRAATEGAVPLGEGVERAVDLQAVVARRLDEGGHEVEPGALEALPHAQLGRHAARIDHLSRGALHVEHERGDARLAALGRVVADRIGIGEADPVGRAVEPHHLALGRLPGSSAAAGQQRQGGHEREKEFFHLRDRFLGFPWMSTSIVWNGSATASISRAHSRRVSARAGA